MQDDMPVALQASMGGIKMSTELFNAEEIGRAKHAEHRRERLRYRGPASLPDHPASLCDLAAAAASHSVFAASMSFLAASLRVLAASPP